MRVFKFCRGCRAKLDRLVEIERRAFCSRGCHDQFFRRHCRVCSIETPSLSGRRTLNLCSRKCRAAYKLNPRTYNGLGPQLGALGYWGSLDGRVDRNSPDISTLFSGVIADRPLIVWTGAGKRACDVVAEPKHPGLFIVHAPSGPVTLTAHDLRHLGVRVLTLEDQATLNRERAAPTPVLERQEIAA